MNKVSVIIRSRNEERWIGHAIQSIIDHLPDSEIIIVDNNSQDETKNIVKNFKRDPDLNSSDRSRYTDINIMNISEYTPGKSINLGIKEATNNICLILSAHCVINKFNLMKIKKDIKKYASIFGNQIPIWNGKKITKRYIWSHFSDEEQVNMFSKLENRYFLHNAFAIYDNFLLSNPFDEGLQGKEDRYWAIKVINEGNKILYDPSLEVMHHYTVNGSTWKD